MERLDMERAMVVIVLLLDGVAADANADKQPLTLNSAS